MMPLGRRVQIIPGDGEVIEGGALVNEAAITGKSAPVIRAEWNYTIRPRAGANRSG